MGTVHVAVNGTLMRGLALNHNIGKVLLHDGSTMLGVLGEAWLCAGKPEITAWGGWRAYCDQQRRL
jgi:hypothetical protein